DRQLTGGHLSGAPSHCSTRSWCPLETLSFHQPLQCFHIPLVVPRGIYRCFGDEGCVSQARIVQQTAKWFRADASLPDVLMSIEFGAARGFGVVTVPDADVLQTNGLVQMSQCFLHAVLSDDVISSYVYVARVDA